MKIIHTKDKLKRPGLYLTHAQNHITWAVAAMDSCFALIGAESLFNTIGKNKFP